MAGIHSNSQLLEEKENNLSILEKHGKEMLSSQRQAKTGSEGMRKFKAFFYSICVHVP